MRFSSLLMQNSDALFQSLDATSQAYMNYTLLKDAHTTDRLVDKVYVIYQRIAPSYLKGEMALKSPCPPYLFANCYSGPEHLQKGELEVTFDGYPLERGRLPTPEAGKTYEVAVTLLAAFKVAAESELEENGKALA